MNKLKTSIMQIPSKVIIFTLIGLRPLLGVAQCRYQVSCTRFAVQQLQEHDLLRASWHIIRRLASCNPFSRIYEIPLED